MLKNSCDETRGRASVPDTYIVYEELKEHSSYSDAWISINGIVYDVTQFIDKHPFGDTFRGHLGTECGGLFSSAHCNTNTEALLQDDDFLRSNNIQVVGRLDVSRDHLHRDSDNRFLDRIIYRATGTDEFWLDLKSRVTSYLNERGETTHYTFREGALLIAYYFSIFIFLSYLTWIHGSFLAAALLGFHAICALANISHMATHHGFTRSRLLDFIAIYLFDLSGMSGLEWQITHQTHHTQPHSSIDHQANVYDYIGVRIHEYMRRRTHHKYQYVYFWLVVSVYLLFKVFATTVWVFANRAFVRHKHEMAAHLLAKGILLALVICCVYLHGWWIRMTAFAVYSIAYSQTAFILLFNDHKETHEVLGQTEDVGTFHGKMLDLLEASGLFGADWVGASVGGTLAAEVAALSPSAASRLVLIAPFGLFDENEPVTDVWAQRQSELPGLLSSKPERLAEFLAPPEDIDPIEWQILLGRANEAAARLLWPTGDLGLHKRLHRIRIPTLILVGSEDRVIPASYAKRLASGISGWVEVRSIEGAGHMAELDQPDAVAEAILGFLG